MIKSIVFVLIAWILTDEPCECFLTQCEVIKFIFEDDATVVERIRDGVVACLELLLCEWDLRKVELTLVRIRFQVSPAHGQSRHVPVH